jgi:hypothetical protein
VIRSILALGFLLLASAAFGQDVLEYRFSTGEEIRIQLGGSRVALEITNPSDAHVECEIASLLDSTSPDPVLSRVVFQPVEGSSNCLGGGCTAAISPPPKIALWSSVGPFAPGESRRCEFDVHVVESFSAPLTLLGSAGPVVVVPPATSIPALGRLGLLLLISGVGFIGVRSLKSTKA